MIDSQAFTRSVESQRAQIHRHCYRMTGSFHDAEDLTQETVLLAWRRLGEFRGDSSMDTWLYRIATNLCLSFLRSQRRRGLPGAGFGYAYQHGDSLPEPDAEAVWLEPYPTPEELALRREDISLVFLTLLQALPPRQRAAIILANVLGYAAKEIAPMLDCSIVAVNSSLQRARRALGSWRESAAINRGDVAPVLERYVSAWESGDAQAIVALVCDDATMVMPPYPVWVHGKADILRVLLDYPMNRGQRWRMLPTQRANGDFAFGFYNRAADGSGQGWGVQVLSFESGAKDMPKIARINVFKGPALLAVFGLDRELGS